jgi:hypothetical protein
MSDPQSPAPRAGTPGDGFIMKTRSVLPLVLVLVLVVTLGLTACGTDAGKASTSGAGAAASTPSSAEASAAQAALSPVARTILGTFKLEDGELAVDKAQAATLLPLWQAYRSLLSSDTTAPAELEALLSQIGKAMTPAQQDAIAAMDLTSQSMFDMAQELGVTSFGPARGTAVPGTGGRSFDGMGPGGMAPPDGFIPGQGRGQGGGAAEGLDPQLLATLQARRASGGGQDRFSLALLDPLIKLLKERAGS